MPDPTPPESPDPGRRKDSRVIWGEQVLKAFESVRLDVVFIGQTVQSSQNEIAKLGEKMEVLHEIQLDVAAFKGSTNAIVSELIEFKKRSEALIIDTERTKTEFNYLKSLTKWAVGVGITVVLLLGGAAAGVVSLKTELSNTTKSIDIFRADNKQELLTFKQELGGLRKDTKEEYSELRKAVEGMNRAVDKFQASIEIFNNKFTNQDLKIERIHKIIDEIDKSKGESFSEFMTQRSLLTKNDLNKRVEKKNPLIFEVKLPYDSLSPARSSRPSAVLAIPHDQILDTIGFQIKVKKGDDGIFNISIAGSESSLDTIEKFLNNNGSIPVDMTIRTPVER
jgi:soluble P-type ATPase